MCGETKNQYNVSMLKEKLYAIQVCLTGDGFSLGIICYTLTVLNIVATLVRDEFGFYF